MESTRKQHKPKTGVFDQPCKLMVKTVELLKKDGREPLEMYRDTGIPPHWIRTLMKQEHKNPSVNRIVYLYEYLSGEQLIK